MHCLQSALKGRPPCITNDSWLGRNRLLVSELPIEVCINEEGVVGRIGLGTAECDQLAVSAYLFHAESNMADQGHREPTGFIHWGTCDVFPHDPLPARACGFTSHVRHCRNREKERGSRSGGPVRSPDYHCVLLLMNTSPTGEDGLIRRIPSQGVRNDLGIDSLVESQEHVHRCRPSPASRSPCCAERRVVGEPSRADGRL